jgi:O-antigen/teichoic acid export membrane protein
MSLKQKTIAGVVWTMANTIVVKGFSFVAMLLLARWLGPVEFGLIGMIAVFIGIGNSLVDSGLSASLIRTKNTGNADYSTVFYMNLGMSLIVYGILFFSAPYIAQFYGQEILTPVIRIYCLSFIISAFSAVQLALLNKEMRFKHLMLLTAPSTFIGAGAGLALGFYGYGVWSIVMMYLLTQAILSVLLWITASWKPSLVFSREKMREHYSFGYKLMVSGLLNTLFRNSYHVVIGKFFPVNILGYFERAVRFNEYPSMTFTEVISKVTYPMMAELQNDPEKLASVYRRVLRISFFCIAPVMLGAAAVANPLFKLVLGEQWLPAVPYFQILSLAFMLYPVHAFNINVLKVYGRSDLFLKLEFVKKGMIILALYIGFMYGMEGIVWSMVVTSFLALFINTYYSSRFINYSTKDQLLDLLPILALAGITYFLMYHSVIALDTYPMLMQILAPTAIGALFYVLMSSFVVKGILNDMLRLLKSYSL